MASKRQKQQKRNPAPSNLHPVAQMALQGLGRIFANAVNAAVDSVLEDVEEHASEVKRRAARGREHLRKRPRGADEEED